MEGPVSILRVENVVLVAGKVFVSAESRPDSRPIEQIVVGHRQFLQLRPIVYLAVDEPQGLHDLGLAVVVKVPRFDVPAPAVPRRSAPPTLVAKCRDPLLKKLRS